MSTSNTNSTRPETLKYALIGAAAMGATIYLTMFIGMPVMHGRIFTGLGEPADFYGFCILWICMGAYAGIGFHRDYLTHIAVFMENHKDLPPATAKKFAVESFKIKYAGQLLPVVAGFPVAYYAFEGRLPDSIAGFAFIAAAELLALWLYRVKTR
ncbi:hypothetical protein [uncultured Muribaculum sp.]|uniref:hypothetical protein n=1 Tax=uncultured Muribaculum sp. TaxID=1918613 RepID=UPI0025F117CC|nr:hypothetical protein [uncultured Muribaculum sp.]